MDNINDSKNIIYEPAQKKKKPFFVLSRKNQKGQVAIFVALIFQIVFIFFALLINVGLLVHHKINLQQSADLAAYYGAMKQAEMLNVISHVNFQLRQAWKLLAWRYRVAGTFGMYQLTDPQAFPANTRTGGFAGGSGGGFTATPALCISHVGFGDWPGAKDKGENFCKFDASQLSGMQANIIRAIGSLRGESVTGAATAPAINAAIEVTNTNLEKTCKQIGELGEAVLATFLSNYGSDKGKKLLAIEALFSNLTNENKKFIDLNGDLVETGVKNTFEKNLTEANKVSTGDSFQVLNGVSDDFSTCGDCKNQKLLYKEILFDYLAFFRQQCDSIGTGRTLESLSFSFVPAGQYAGKYAIGVEKNPWYQVYYGVRAQSEPKIPFLPLAKIRLSAVAFAKPFGGSVGPWSSARWQSGASESSGPAVDSALPNKTAGGGSQAAAGAKSFINFANYVGDSKGLEDPEYVGKYHEQLLGGPIGSNNGAVKMSGWSGGAELGAGAFTNLELSAIAPNQFDATYYSIDYDFENNYWKKLTDNKFVRKLQESTGASVSFSKDYAGTMKAQMDPTSPATASFAIKNWEHFLTSWTFLSLTNETGYSRFPTEGTMKFGQCEDAQPVHSLGRPPSPGNCVTGGRTGYSVKIVSQEILNGLQGDIGGASTGGRRIENPVPKRFLDFE
jgi:hypothetical protein